MNAAELTTISATEMATRIRDGALSSREAVDAHIASIERWNPHLNAVVATRFEQAREEADRADVLARDGTDLGPFHGVPCTIKESFWLTGMPNTAGLVHRRDVVADKDATAVARLRDAGAIPLGVTNISEGLMWMESDNRVYGRTNNPYDQRRIPGGSSGGEGAIVGAGASPMGLGADIGGSIRLPAFFCGVFGHKPTGGLVPGTGQYPLAENDALRYLTTGPIARRADDLFPFLRVIAGPDGSDPQCRAWSLGDPANVQIDELRVLAVAGNDRIAVSADLHAAQQRVASYLASCGAEVTNVKVPALRRSFELWGACMERAADTSFREILGGGQPIKVGRSLAEWLVGRSPHTLAALALAALELIPVYGGRLEEQFVRATAQLQHEIETLIGPHGVMLYPSYSRPAPRHGRSLLHPFDAMYTAIINVLELPSTQVPLGLNPLGQPLGIQVVGTRGNDHLTIAVARALEQAFGGWLPPTPPDSR